MDQPTLGPGVSLSIVGLGGFELGSGETPTLDEAIRVVRTALDGGVNWLDTAEAYLDSDGRARRRRARARDRALQLRARSTIHLVVSRGKAPLANQCRTRR
jgi:aryl-alcohol dehydrogenase-like predicted oxidoreductase